MSKTITYRQLNSMTIKQLLEKLDFLELEIARVKDELRRRGMVA